VFVILFFTLQTIYYFLRPAITPFVVDKLTTGMSLRIINTFSHTDKPNAQSAVISSENFSLKIERGCEGTEGMLLLVAAICAFPAGIRQKVLGITGGILVIYVFNLGRIAGLYFTLKLNPNLFDMMHIYVGQTIIIFIAIVFFIAWLSRIERTSRKN